MNGITYIAPPYDASPGGSLRIEESETREIADDGTHHDDVIEVRTGQFDQPIEEK